MIVIVREVRHDDGEARRRDGQEHAGPQEPEAEPAERDAFAGLGGAPAQDDDRNDRDRREQRGDGGLGDQPRQRP